MAIKKNTNDLISQAATTLADNSTQDISPQDVREMAENNAFSSYNKITDNNLVGLKNYSTAATYEAAQGVVYNGSIYISNTIPTPGAFNASEWDILVGGEINTSSNSGAGEGLALAKSGSNLPFKSLTAGTGITLTSAANELQISSAGGTDTNIGNADLTQTDQNRRYTLHPTDPSKITFEGTSGSFHLQDDIPFKLFTGSDSTASNVRFSAFVNSNACYLDLNNGRTAIRTVSDDMTLSGSFATSNRTNIILGADIIIQSKDTRSVQLKANHLFFMNNAGTTKGRINANTFIWGSNTAIGSEGFSVQKDTLIKGSNNSAATSGFKVTDVNNNSLLDVRNNGALKLQYLPSLPAGTVAGDVWSQNGTLRIGNPTENIQTEVSAATITPNIDTTKLIVTSALAAALTIAAPTGTPQEGQELTFRFKDDGTARALTWNAIFEDYTGSLPTTTTAGKTVYIGCKYNLINTKWDVVAVQTQP